jgi:hypothetical protein
MTDYTESITCQSLWIPGTTDQVGIVRRAAYHAQGNPRALMNIAGELLAVAAQREARQIDRLSDYVPIVIAGQHDGQEDTPSHGHIAASKQFSATRIVPSLANSHDRHIR